jgi:hypothetical protein
MLEREKIIFINLYLLLSSPLSLLQVLDPKKIPTSRNFWFLVIFYRNHSPKKSFYHFFFLDINLLRASFL